METKKYINEYTIGIHNGEYPIYCNLYPKNEEQEIEIKKLIELGYAKKSIEKTNIKCLTDEKYIKDIDNILNLHINDNKIKDINNYSKNKLNGGDILNFRYLKNDTTTLIKFPLNFHSYDNYNDNSNISKGVTYNYISTGESFTRDKIISGMMCYNLGRNGEIYDCSYVLYHITFHPPYGRFKEYEIHIQFSFYLFPIKYLDFEKQLPPKITLQLKYIFPLDNKIKEKLYSEPNQSLKYYLLKINEFLGKPYNSIIIINGFRFLFSIDNTFYNMKKISLNIQNIIGENIIILYPYIVLSSQISSGIINFSKFEELYVNRYHPLPTKYTNIYLDINKIIHNITKFNYIKLFNHFYFNDTNDITTIKFTPKNDTHYIIYNPPFDLSAKSFIPSSLKPKSSFDINASSFTPSSLKSKSSFDINASSFKPSFTPSSSKPLNHSSQQQTQTQKQQTKEQQTQKQQTKEQQTKGGSNIDYKEKYLKYKLKYLELKKEINN